MGHTDFSMHASMQLLNALLYNLNRLACMTNLLTHDQQILYCLA